MLTSKYSDALIELVSSEFVKDINPEAYSLGAGVIQLALATTNCKVSVQLIYESPLGTLQTQAWADDYTETNYDLYIQDNHLQPGLTPTNWLPRVHYANNLLTLQGLPNGEVNIKVSADFSLLYHAHYSIRGQVPGTGTTTTIPTIITTLTQALDPTKPPQVLVSLLAGIADIHSRYPGLLPNTFYRFQGPNPINDAEQYDLTDNLVLAVLTLSALYTFKLNTPAQVVDLNGLEPKVVSYLHAVAQAASAALDPKTGLVFSKRQGALYGNPGYVCTALALILWHELYTGYESNYLYLQSIYYAHRRFVDITHNPELEPRDRYLLAQALINRYSGIETNVQFLTLDQQVQVLTLYDLLVINSSLTPVAGYTLDLPRASVISSVQELTFSTQVLELILFNHMVQSMPQGYLWVVEADLKGASVYGSIYRALAATLALGLKHYEARVGNTAAPGFYPGTDSIWARILYPKPTGTPAIYWQAWLYYYTARPGVGVSRLDWTAYYAGLSKFTVELYDYQWLQLPRYKVIADSPTLQTIDLTDPTNLNLNTADPYVNYIDALNDYPPPTLLGTALPDIAAHTNQITFCGMGRPAAVQRALADSATAGVVHTVKHYTYALAQPSRSVLRKSTVTILL